MLMKLTQGENHLKSNDWQLIYFLFQMIPDQEEIQFEASPLLLRYPQL